MKNIINISNELYEFKKFEWFEKMKIIIKNMKKKLINDSDNDGYVNENLMK